MNTRIVFNGDDGNLITPVILSKVKVLTEKVTERLFINHIAGF
jgi:hypothetical protein